MDDVPALQPSHPEVIYTIEEWAIIAAGAYFSGTIAVLMFLGYLAIAGASWAALAWLLRKV
jgi:hypothetical protein